MTAIAGYLTARHRDADTALSAMLDAIRRERFNASGACNRPALGLHAGWVSSSDACPCVWNRTQDIGLLLTGELVDSQSGPHPDRLQQILASYEQTGYRCLEQLNGWFSGLFFDLRQRQTVLFNDRYGRGRIYFHEGIDGFYFASEAKALLKVLPHTRQLDPQALGEWLSCGCALGNRTLFSGIFLLPPGSAWILSADGKVTKGSYFDPAAWETQPSLTAAEFYEQLKQTFPVVLKRYVNGDQPVAMSLTGGLDGRMIMAWSPRPAGELPCYTFNGPFRDCADLKIAREVAGACGQAHLTIPVADRFITEFPALAEQTIRLSDGAMDVTGAAELYVNRLASYIAPVRLTGNYGSEILRSYVGFKPRRVLEEIFAREIIAHAHTAGRTYTAEAAGRKLSFIAFKQVPWHHFARFTIEQSQLRIRSPYLDNDLVALAFRAPPDVSASLEPSMRLIAEGNPRLGQIATDRGMTYPAGAAGNRLHRSLQEFLAKAEYAYDYGMPQWMARVDKCLSPLRLERLFLGRQKFCHFRLWYRRQLAGYVKEVLLDPRSRSRSYLNGLAVEPLVNAHVQGTGNYTVEIHKLLSLELLHRTLLAPS